MASTRFELVTPTQTLFSGEAEAVFCRAEGGEIAFLAHHMPYLGVLEPSVVRIVQPSQSEDRMAVLGGFVEVRDNKVIMLADVAEPANEQLSGAADDAEAQAALRRATVRLEVAGAL